MTTPVATNPSICGKLALFKKTLKALLMPLTCSLELTTYPLNKEPHDLKSQGAANLWISNQMYEMLSFYELQTLRTHYFAAP